jgi:hypothetical protein
VERTVRNASFAGGNPGGSPQSTTSAYPLCAAVCIDPGSATCNSTAGAAQRERARTVAEQVTTPRVRAGVRLHSDGTCTFARRHHGQAPSCVPRASEARRTRVRCYCMRKSGPLHRAPTACDATPLGDLAGTALRSKRYPLRVERDPSLAYEGEDPPHNTAINRAERTVCESPQRISSDVVHWDTTHPLRAHLP